MTPEINNLFVQFFQELSTKSAEIAIEASKHTGIFVSFYDVGKTVTNLLKTIFH